METQELIKLIDNKIKELEAKEKPEELLKKALVKKGIIKSIDNIDNKKIDEIFSSIKNMI